MTNLRKRDLLQFRCSPEQLRRVGIAACLASRKRHVEVDEGPLAREFTMAGVERMIAAATPDELAQADADWAERVRVEARKAGKDQKSQERSGRDRRRQPRRAADASPV